MALEPITELLRKQRRVESLLHGQSMPRREFAERLLERQHNAELAALLHRCSAPELGSLLESLPLRDAAWLWQHVPQSRHNEVLWEISDEVRHHLDHTQEPTFMNMQLNVFEAGDGRLRQVPVENRRDLEGVRPVWVDLLNATRAERAFIGSVYGVVLPDPKDATDLEVSTRFHRDEQLGIHLHSNFLLDRAGNSRSVPVVFIVHGGILFSLRNEELPVFRLQRRRATAHQGFHGDCYDLLLDLYGSDVEYCADSLEDIYTTLGKVGHLVLAEGLTDSDAAAVLADIAEEEDLNGRIRSNILDTQRAIQFLTRSRILSATQFDDARQILQNIDSLNNHTSFLFDKINFLLDATVGFVNVNQNRRINQLTVLSVVLMPVNILAGVGGMSEFSMMTQGIAWPIAYAAFLVGAGALGAATYLWIRRSEDRSKRAR